MREQLHVRPKYRLATLLIATTVAAVGFGGFFGNFFGICSFLIGSIGVYLVWVCISYRQEHWLLGIATGILYLFVAIAIIYSLDSDDKQPTNIRQILNPRDTNNQAP